MKKLLSHLTLLLLITQSTLVLAGWESARNIGDEPTGDLMIIRCRYETIGGFRFSTTARGICPFSVEVNPETGKVKSNAPTFGSATSSGQWESATNTGDEPTGDSMITRCKYETIGGFRFSTTARGICPFSVEVNPETGKVKSNTSPFGGSPSSGRWESATNIGDEPTGDLMITRCRYETIGGFRFSTTVRGICPFSVEVNPETGKVRK